MLFLLLSLYAPVVAQTEAWREHRARGDKLRDAGSFKQAEDAYAAALQEAEKFGPSDPRVAACLNSLALLYYAQRNYPPAKQLYQRRYGSRHPGLQYSWLYPKIHTAPPRAAF
jgi:tetratricopeptide (TPR) repeat protein